MDDDDRHDDDDDDDGDADGDSDDGWWRRRRHDDGDDKNVPVYAYRTLLPLQWRHNERHENHRRLDGLLNNFIQTQIKENIKAPRHWPLWGEFTGDRWIPFTNGQ